MTGFQIFLCVLGGIILFFVLVLSIPVHVSMHYGDKIYLSVRYLFIRLNILPLGEKKEKKPKKKKEKPKSEKPKEEGPKEKKPNPLLQMVKANGYDGMIEVISNLGRIFALYGGKIFKSVVFEDIEIYISVGTGDSAQTAIKYGKTCQKVYPLLGFLCANNVVKKYEASVEPDFLANNSEGEFNFEFYLVVRKIINATLGMVFRLIFKVVLKFLKNGRKKKESTPQQNAETKKG